MCSCVFVMINDPTFKMYNTLINAYWALERWQIKMSIQIYQNILLYSIENTFSSMSVFYFTDLNDRTASSVGKRLALVNVLF